MQVEALVLAGGVKVDSLQEQASETSEALIKIGERIMVDYVVQVLNSSDEVERIAVVGPEELLKNYYRNSETELLLAPPGDSPMGSVRNGMKVLSPRRMMLVVTGDIPLLSVEAVQDFLDKCKGIHADLYYPIVRKETNEQKYPGVQRTYVRLKEGTFTGGNLFLVRPEVVESCFDQAEKLVKLRKNPLALSKQVGLGFIIKLLLHRLTMKETEKRFSKLLGLKGVAIVSPFPEIGIDVDKPSDLELVRRVLAI